uniref:Uncharacterized protein n=1 Tax=Cyclopterus lumpus TaxID=8103 RepID=A0A8C3AHB1_CYCLU
MMYPPPLSLPPQSAPQGTCRHAASAGRPGTGSLQGSTERRLREAVQRCWKEIQKNCTEEDPQQEGHISTTSFLEILHSLSIRMTREQLERLAVKFDIINNGRVSYHNFLRHFLLTLKPAETKTPYGRRKLPLPIAPAVHSSWNSVRRRFLTCDPARAGSVPAQDFRKVLQHFSVDLSSEEFFQLSSYLDADGTGRMCYNNFLWAFLH